MTQFTDFGLAEPILRAVAAEGYTTPTPIQTAAIPAILAGRDVLGTAQTGTGKTASFVLPLLHRLAQQPSRPQPRTCTVVILTPTRELAAQITANIRTYGKFLRVSVATVVGGVKPGPQIRALATGVHVVVATPGRLLDHMRTGAIGLAHTTAVVLDEADQMLDLGFLPDIRKILGKLPQARQTIMMSATMPPQIRALTRDFQQHPQEIAVATVARPIERISQSVRHTPAAHKRTVLADILSDRQVERAIVFTRTKRGADRVSRHLTEAGFAAAAIHGNKTQVQRDRTLAGFRAGRTSILVATDIAARGIDIDEVSHVINFELPQVAEAYVHRIGRTARAGRAGTAISLCDPSEVRLLRDIERLIGNAIDSQGTPAPLPEAPRKRRRNKSKAPAQPPKRTQSPKRNQISKRTRRQAKPDQATSGLDRMLRNPGPAAAQTPAC